MANLDEIRNGLSVNTAEEDRQELITAGPSNEGQNDLQSTREPYVKTLPTVPVLALFLLLLVGMVVLPYLLPVLCPQSKCAVTPLALLIYLQAALWLIFLIFEFYLRSQHHKLRNYGYLQFYARTRMLRRAPIIIWSAGGIALLVLMAVMEKHCTQLHFIKNPNTLDMIDCAKIVISLESVSVFGIIVKELVETVRFNRSRTLPDVHQEEGMNSDGIAGQPEDVGFRDGTRLTEVLERQTDMIAYLRQHNQQLGERLCEMQGQIDNLRRCKAMIPERACREPQ